MTYNGSLKYCVCVFNVSDMDNTLTYYAVPLFERVSTYMKTGMYLPRNALNVFSLENEMRAHL